MESKIIAYDEVDSTNTRICQMAADGAAEGLVVTAKKQSAGKGRRGRNWESEAECNLYFSILLRPEICPQKAPMLTLVMAYSVAKAIGSSQQTMPQIKWPNDLVIGGKKLCGILTEMHMAGQSIDYVVIGTGVNVNQDRFSKELQEKATSLWLETGCEWECQDLLKQILAEFGKQYEKFLNVQDLSFLRAEYNQMLVNKDREVLVLEPGNEYRAYAKGITSTGELIVVKEDGSEETVFAGEVSVRGIYGYV